MLCPHCQIGTSPNFEESTLGWDDKHQVDVLVGQCTECNRLIAIAKRFQTSGSVQFDDSAFPLFPARVPPRPIPDEVSGEYATDFREACLVLADSPKASAALSRRLLQQIIREKAGIKCRDLDKEIDALIESSTLPSDLAEDLDMIRTVGNFATHPVKATDTGRVVEVEPGEAEGLLDLIEELLDHYFVRPAKRGQKRAALNEKLASAEKPELKQAAGSSSPTSDEPNA